MNCFDESGDLWIEVQALTLPPSISKSFAPGSFIPLKDFCSGLATAVTAINLTRYIRDLIADQTGAVP